MYRFVLFLIVIILTSCHSNKPGTISDLTVDNRYTLQTMPNLKNDSIVRYFKTPESLIEYYYKAIEEGDLQQIAACLGHSSTSGLSYKKAPGIKYNIISKESFEDPDHLNLSDSSNKSDQAQRHYKLLVITKDSSDAITGHLTHYYWLDSIDGSWTIVGHSSDVESQMQEAETEATEAADTILD